MLQNADFQGQTACLPSYLASSASTIGGNRCQANIYMYIKIY